MSGFVALILVLVIHVEQRLWSDSQTGSSQTAVLLSGFQCRCGLKGSVFVGVSGWCTRRESVTYLEVKQFYPFSITVAASCTMQEQTSQRRT